MKSILKNFYIVAIVLSLVSCSNQNREAPLGLCWGMELSDATDNMASLGFNQYLEVLRDEYQAEDINGKEITYKRYSINYQEPITWNSYQYDGVVLYFYTANNQHRYLASICFYSRVRIAYQSLHFDISSYLEGLNINEELQRCHPHIKDLYEVDDGNTKWLYYDKNKNPYIAIKCYVSPQIYGMEEVENDSRYTCVTYQVFGEQYLSKLGLE